MEKLITSQNIRNFAYVNENLCKGKIKGIIVRFLGLGLTVMHDTDTDEGKYYAEKNILYVMPYNNPWSWMNKQAVAYTNEIIDVLIQKYNLSESLPIVYMGGSMGGLSALTYSVYSKYKPIACVVNCPVCDTIKHLNERNEIPKTLYSALFNYECSFEDAVKSVSPIHLIEKMPKIPYNFFHGNKDIMVSIDHSKTMVAELKKRNYEVTFDIAEGCGHGELTPETKAKFLEYPAKAIEKFY